MFKCYFLSTEIGMLVNLSLFESLFTCSHNLADRNVTIRFADTQVAVKAFSIYWHLS